MNYINHYKLGFETVEHRGKQLVVSNRTALFDYLNSLETRGVEVGFIPTGYEHRPDLISNLFYNTVTLDWLICMYNNISDPHQQLNVNDRILLPKL